MSSALNCDGEPGGPPVFTAGLGPNRIQTSVCPQRALEGSDAPLIVEWWLLTTHRDPWTGMPSGPPEWPLLELDNGQFVQGGMLDQPARLVDAVELLIFEYPAAAGQAKDPGPKAEGPPPEPPRPSAKGIRQARRARQ